jgi:tryptophan synthase alpha chain
MKQKIIRQIQAKNQSGHIALVAFLPVAFPSPGNFKELVKIAVEEGADVIELGIPRTDPYLDGDTIRNAYTTILQAGWTIDQLLEMGGEALTAAGGLGFPLVYAETVDDFGGDAFFHKLSTSGYQGFLAPNVTPEQRRSYKKLALKHDIEIMGFVKADSTQVESQEVIDQSHGFIYMQGIAGATGQKIEVNQDLLNRYKNLKSAAQPAGLPVLIGFGIRDAKDVANIRDMHADGAILGTSFVKAALKPKADFRQYVNSLSMATEERA